MELLLVFVVVAVIATMTFRMKKRARTERKLEAIINKHLETLARKRLQKIKVDSYGIMDKTEWNSEVQYFFDNVVRPSLTDSEARLIGASLNFYANRFLNDPVRRRCEEMEQTGDFDPDMTGHEFEHFCARLLRKEGWEVDVTTASQDQGTDLVARKNGTWVALQCKKYAAPIGNRAVQEASAGRRHTMAHHGAVVTNSSFTKSAIALARTNDVLLLHFSELARLETIISGGTSHRP